jgi:Ca-activated chloride channel family protein
MAIGTQAGAPIPLGNGGFLRDQNSEIVVPSVPITRLRDFTTRHGGLFTHLTLDDADVQAAVDFMGSVEDLNRTEIERQADTWADAGFWLVIPWLLVMLIQFLRNPSGRLAGLVLIASCAALSHPSQVQAQDWQSLWKTPNQRAAELLPKDPAAAAELFEDPRWAAIAAYQAEDHDQAKARFEALEANSATDWYNLGNARAKAGELEAALEAYNQSIALQETDDAVFNRDLIQQLLDQEQQQQSQDMDQQGDGSQSQQDQNNSETDANSGEQEQNSESESSASDASEQASNPEQDKQQEEAQAQNQNNQAQDGQEQDQHQAVAQESINEQQQAMAQQAIQEARENQEQQQAMEQWIRRIEDDPSGLLREKFRYESERRQTQDRPRNDKKIW